MSDTRYYYVCQGATGCASAQGLTDDARTACASHSPLEEFLARHGGEVEPGSPVVDLVPLADRPDLSRLAWQAPMADCRLAGEDVDRFEGDQGGDLPGGIAALLAAAYFGEAGARAASTTTTGEPGPFDYVSPVALASYWLRHGARIGYWNGTEVKWRRETS